MAPSRIPLLVSRTRPRGNSEPKIESHQTQQPTQLKRRQSVTSRVYDEDYKSYILDCSLAGITPSTEPWTAVPSKLISNVAEATQAFYYAKYRLKLRNVTPRTQAFLPVYQRSLEDMIQDPSNNEKKAVANAHNEVLHSKIILYKDRLCKLDEHIRAIKDLARLRYFGDYGDYVALRRTAFRQAAEAAKVENVDRLLGKSWGEIMAIKREEDIDLNCWREMRIWRKENKLSLTCRPNTPMTKTIFQACDTLGIHYDSIWYAIEWYANRNAGVVPFYIQRCDWENLGIQLWKDLRDVPSIFGDNDKMMMTKTLECIRDKYFCELAACSRVPSELADKLKREKVERDLSREKERNKNRREDVAKKLETERRLAEEVQEKRLRKVS
ncbi:MAG: hypothetical protein L6R40_001581 [Gallowayella cf. fulva]|nr:MAG: hypothetical protein L6R40_001581 [Xanthomendoza cf. fulva]